EMRTISKMLFVLLVLSLVNVAAAWAVDTCFIDDVGSILVGKGFTFPTTGNCKAFNGYLNGAGNVCLISGTACGTSDGLRVKVNLTYSWMTDGAGNYWFIINRFNADLNEAGLGNACQINPANGTWFCSVSFHVKKVTCPNPHPLSTVP